MSEEVQKALVFEVSSLADLARLAASMVAYGLVMPIYAYSDGGSIRLFVQSDYRDYYKQYGLPIIYMYAASSDEIGKGKYVLIKVDETGERVEVSDKARPGWTSIPIIWLKGKPSIMP